MAYDKLFSPIVINGMISKNRIIATPTNNDFEEKALGGAGIVVAGHAIVQYGKSSFASPTEPGLFSKYEVEGAVDRVRKIHAGGAKASIELFHGGRYARVIDWAMGPDDEVRDDGVQVRAMDESMMRGVCDAYAQTAKNARDIGFDMILLHFGHGWLPAQFLSPLFNHRTDEYGGSLENRMRFPLMILKAVREAVGASYPVEMRISAYEWVPGSIEFEDVKTFIVEAEPYIDMVQISAGLDINHEGNVHCTTTNFVEHMPNVAWAAEVKRSVGIPVSVVGAIMSPDEAESILEGGQADLVAFGRPFIADPNWPNKVLSGHVEDATPCLRCLYCYHIATNHRNVGCSVNPRFKNESFIPSAIAPASARKRVAIVGGGPGGMRAAITAAERGHEVVLFEAADELGGQLRFVAKEHFKEDVARYLTWLRVQISKRGVDVRLGVRATPDMVAALDPDAVIIAVGAEETLPPIPSIDCGNVLRGTEAIDREGELSGDIVVIGGGTVGAEIALEQALIRGNHVTIVEMGDELAAQGNMLYKIGLRQTMEQCEALDVLLNASCQEIREEGVIVRDSAGVVRELPADHVIVCTGLRSRSDLAKSFYGITPNTTMIGDCVNPRKIMEATFEGHAIALNL